METYRGYVIRDDEEAEGKKDGVDAILADSHPCNQPNNRLCWDCAFCGNRYACSEPVDGYGNPVKS